MADAFQEPRPDDSDGGGPVKSFLEHLEDFRWLLVKCSVAVGLGMLICLFAANYVIAIIKWPLTRAPMSWPGTNQIATVSFGTNHLGNFEISPPQSAALDLGTNRFVAVTVEPLKLGTNQILGWRMNADPQAVADLERMHIELVNLSPAGGFFVAFQAGIYGGLVLASPFIMYFVASFVFPALKMRERKYIYRAIFIGGGLFLAGVSFCYFILMPVALAASQMYSSWLGFGATQWRAEDYISFVCRFMLGMGLGFEMPVVILTLVKIGVLNYNILSKARRYMIVINLALGALLTTPEVLTQVMMFIPLQGLFELSVWIAWYWEQPDRAKARRKLLLVLLLVALAAVAGWEGWKSGWPWLQQHWH
jgi:sec-independent protein translocase protein TatC